MESNSNGKKILLPLKKQIITFAIFLMIVPNEIKRTDDFPAESNIIDYRL